MKKMNARGALIVIEGCDRSGKSTQCKRIVEHLTKENIQAQIIAFPERSTEIGMLIDRYLRGCLEISDQAVHLLFSANRWEMEPKIRKLLKEGTTLIVDRYSYSGIAYSCAKEIESMDFNWCKSSEVGLPKPDLVLFLSLEPDVILKREGFGEERYEKLELQKKLSLYYDQLKDDSWQVIDADLALDDISENLLGKIKTVIEKISLDSIDKISCFGM